MITLYTGTPGSGKSLHVAKVILERLQIDKKNVIANFEVNEEVINKKRFMISNKTMGKFYYLDNSKLTVDALVDYAKKNHILGKEHQTLLVIDECQTFFNPREFQRKDRLDWNNFFSQHRKLGYEVILVTQNDRLIDRQIRALVEYEIKHRKVNNFKLGKLLPKATFVCVHYWYGVREKLKSTFFTYHKDLGNFYDSFKMFN
ncbi:zonular occludens toxin domain-containing protein [Clostridium perfringens]|nr:zonular occludens toxin domain-containing protein [Clostridium perfringens]MDM0947558.1 zonular occludens toxin domain-containing protein [Clostridium perfringens]HBI7095718.1 AAA family ATPase [Clostridium perfringens]